MTYLRWLCSLIIDGGRQKQGYERTNYCHAMDELFFTCHIEEFTAACGASMVSPPEYAEALLDGDPETGLIEWLLTLTVDESSRIVEHLNLEYWDNGEELIQYMTNATALRDRRSLAEIFFPDGVPTREDAAKRGVKLSDPNPGCET